MKLASEYKAIANLDFADCDTYLETWDESVRYERQDRNPPSYKYYLSRKFMNIHHDAALFERSVGKRLRLDQAVEMTRHFQQSKTLTDESAKLSKFDYCQRAKDRERNKENLEKRSTILAFNYLRSSRETYITQSRKIIFYQFRYIWGCMSGTGVCCPIARGSPGIEMAGKTRRPSRAWKSSVSAYGEGSHGADSRHTGTHVGYTPSHQLVQPCSISESMSRRLRAAA